MIKIYLLLLLISGINLKAQYKDILPAAESGDDFAQLVMGNAYYGGHSIEKNYTKAFFMFEKSAEQGNRAAMYGLALCYENGRGIQQSSSKAFFWYKKSAELGLSRSQREVGKALLKGIGCEKDIDKGVFWLRLACENTEDEACELLNKIKK